MAASVHRIGDSIIVQGALTATDADRLRSRIHRVTRPITLDLSGVRFIDAHALDVIYTLPETSARCGVHLTIVAPRSGCSREIPPNALQ